MNLSFRFRRAERLKGRVEIKQVFARGQTGCAVLGDVGFAGCGISVLGFEDNSGIVLCRHTSVSETVGVLAFITMIDGQKVIVRTIGVSGTVKGAQTKFLKK